MLLILVLNVQGGGGYITGNAMLLRLRLRLPRLVRAHLSFCARTCGISLF